MKPKSCMFEIENSCVKWARKRKKDRKKQECMSLDADTDVFALPGPLRRAASTRGGCVLCCGGKMQQVRG